VGRMRGRGFDDLCIGEHVWRGMRHRVGATGATFARLTIPGAADDVCALAAVTQRVRLVTCILIAPLRPAALLAKNAGDITSCRAVAGARLSVSGWSRSTAPWRAFRNVAQNWTMWWCVPPLWSSSPASFSSKRSFR